MPLSFAGNPKFMNTLPLYTFNIQFMYDNLNFSFLLWNKLHLYFVTFLLPFSIEGGANYISPGSKIVKRLRRRSYYPAIIERAIGLVFGPFTALYRSFLQHCTPTYKAVGITCMTDPAKTPQRRHGLDARPLWLLVGNPSAFIPELVYRLCVAQPTLMDITRYFGYTLILLYMLYTTFYDLSTLVGCLSSFSIRTIIKTFVDLCLFDNTTVAVFWEVGYP